MGTLIGIDVCGPYQGIIDWDKAKAAGCAFAFIRCHYQGGKKDHLFDRNWTEAKRVGIARGAYGWVLPGKNQVEQADLFMGYMGDDLGELAPACDFEISEGKKSTFTELRTFIERVEKLSGKLPYIYTNGGYWSGQVGYANQTWATKYPYWHAQYTGAKYPTLKPPFTNWTFWQYSSPGNRMASTYGAGGYDLDINRFNGDLEDFQKLIGTEVIEPEKPNPELLVRIARLEGKLETLEEWGRSIGFKG